MQQYTPSFYSSYGSPYPTRTPTSKIPSPNSYLTSSYAAAAATNNNSTQLYPSYGYNNFGQFSSTQQDYSGYYQDQYSYYNTAGYSPYVSSPGSSGSQGFHVAAGLSGKDDHPLTKSSGQKFTSYTTNSESPSDGHSSSTPTLLATHAHSPNSPLSISPNASVTAKTTPTTKAGRARGRRHAQPSPTRSTSSETAILDTTKAPERVFIWDLDETIIIFHSLLTGSFASRYTKVGARECLKRGMKFQLTTFIRLLGPKSSCASRLPYGRIDIQFSRRSFIFQ
jgi:hypothetical protein